jgi:hypothetical protein
MYISQAHLNPRQILTRDRYQQFNFFGWRRCFFAKYNANGEYVWAENIGGTGFDEGNALSVDRQAL